MLELQKWAWLWWHQWTEFAATIITSYTTGIGSKPHCGGSMSEPTGSAQWGRNSTTSTSTFSRSYQYPTTEKVTASRWGMVQQIFKKWQWVQPHTSRWDLTSVSQRWANISQQLPNFSESVSLSRSFKEPPRTLNVEMILYTHIQHFQIGGRSGHRQSSIFDSKQVSDRQ